MNFSSRSGVRGVCMQVSHGDRVRLLMLQTGRGSDSLNLPNMPTFDWKSNVYNSLLQQCQNLAQVFHEEGYTRTAYKWVLIKFCREVLNEEEMVALINSMMNILLPQQASFIIKRKFLSCLSFYSVILDQL